ncbi:MAG TPA: hypothetical protein VLL07_06815, partial [Pontiella sp.]|nr:hypothetical protein [Pontiella sp.]
MVAGVPATSLFDFKICEYLMKHLLVVLPLLLLTACGGSKQQAEKQESSAGVQMLELAFDGVSGMPLDPHIRNRARAQEKIVDAALELMQPELAARYAGEIPNWRQAV